MERTHENQRETNFYSGFGFWSICALYYFTAMQALTLPPCDHTRNELTADVIDYKKVHTSMGKDP